MNNLSTHQLNIFLEAAETLNFTQAAQRLQMTQPSVSQHIQALEEQFGIALFSRVGRNIELTEAGLTLIPLAREMIFLASHIQETMASLKGDVHGHLTVGCSTVTGRYLLPRLLADFHRKYPLVRATCQVTSQELALQQLSQGIVHLALASNPPTTPGIEFYQFTREQVILAVHPSHPWADRGEIDIEELDQGDFILPEEGSEIHVAVREALAEKEVSIYHLNTLVSLGSLEAIALSVQENLGIGFVPSLVISRLVKNAVIPVRIKGVEIWRDIFVARNIHRAGTAAQQAFWELICSSQIGKIPSENF